MDEQGGIRCLPIEKAEEIIRAYAAYKNRDSLELSYSEHALERAKERGISNSDVFYILAHGFINEEPQESSRLGYCKYKICSKSPNSGNREICAVVIPDPRKPAIKIVTLMWKDL